MYEQCSLSMLWRGEAAAAGQSVSSCWSARAAWRHARGRGGGDKTVSPGWWACSPTHRGLQLSEIIVVTDVKLAEWQAPGDPAPGWPSPTSGTWPPPPPGASPGSSSSGRKAHCHQTPSHWARVLSLSIFTIQAPTSAVCLLLRALTITLLTCQSRKVGTFSEDKKVYFNVHRCHNWIIDIWCLITHSR